MKAITKQKMVDFLRLQEAKKWERVRSLESHFQILYGENFDKEKLEEIDKIHIQRCTSEWMCIQNILTELEILSFTYSEREELKEQGKL
jgi:hypothetical protein